jgi:hypothetical protein
MKIILVAVSLFLMSAFCVAQERDEAWVRKSAFDGHVYSYEVVAYGAAGGFQVETNTRCRFGHFGKQKILKSVDFKIYISGDFSSPSVSSTKTGTIDVATAVKACLDSAPEVNRDLDSPIALTFPKISVSSKFELR